MTYKPEPTKYIYTSSGYTFEYITVRTRTGDEIHYGSGSSTLCGKWLKFHSSQMHREAVATCEKCLEIANLRNLQKV